MFKHSVAAALASLAFSGLALIATTPSPACAAEINLVGSVSFRVLLPDLLRQFEKSSGHKILARYAPLGVITERVSKGEPIDVPIVSGQQNEELQKQGNLLAGSRVASRCRPKSRAIHCMWRGSTRAASRLTAPRR